MNSRWLIPLAAYFLGSIPFGLLLVKIFHGRDVRAAGSGNIGAANVTRTAGKIAGLVTLVLDAGKGTLAVWLAARWTQGNIRWMMAAAALAVVGHMFPIWLRFRGGKGVATGLGVFIPICGQAVAVALVIWIAVVIFWRYASLGSMAAAAAMPLVVYVLYAPRHAPPTVVWLTTVFISALILWRHRTNLERLLSGSEPRLKLGR
ncbi:MAG: glycerol-3-phosphate 1-O-acyltransferase PlsY [Candidatus Acidiferrales bacterium]